MSKAETRGKTDQAKIAMSEEEWRSKHTPEQFYVTREHGTERAFSHPYYEEKDAGMYRCVCCGAPVFSSETKFDSGTGWPSFYAPANRDAVSEHDDRSFFMRRTEVRCAKCDAHSATSSRMDRSRRVRVIASTVSLCSSTSMRGPPRAARNAKS